MKKAETVVERNIQAKKRIYFIPHTSGYNINVLFLKTRPANLLCPNLLYTRRKFALFRNIKFGHRQFG